MCYSGESPFDLLAGQLECYHGFVCLLFERYWKYYSMQNTEIARTYLASHARSCRAQSQLQCLREAGDADIAFGLILVLNVEVATLIVCLFVSVAPE